MTPETLHIERASSAVRLLGTLFYAGGIAGVALILLVLGNADRLRYVPVPGGVSVSVLRGEVETIHDRAGVWHIFGTDWSDVLAAQGWLHAREHLWQMESARLRALGRFSELVGPAALSGDRLLRTLGLEQVAAGDLDALDMEARGRLEAFASGVNAWLLSPRHRLPPELAFSGWEPAPWRPADSLLLLRLLDLSQNAHWMRDAGAGGQETPSGEQTGVPRAAWEAMVRNLSVRLPSALLAASGRGDRAQTADGGEGGVPSLTVTLAARAAYPAVWVTGGLHLPGRDLVGAVLPGVPGLQSGTTAGWAWSLSADLSDGLDLYVERPDPSAPGRYLYDGSSQPFTTTPETLFVRGGDPVPLQVRRTGHGPVISEALDMAGPPVSIRWTALEGTGLFGTLSALLDADGWEEVLEASRRAGGAARRLDYVDVAGLVASRVIGDIPRRGGWSSGRPLPGWTGMREWEGVLSFEELGFLAPARSGPVPGDGPSLRFRHPLATAWPATALLERGPYRLMDRGPGPSTYPFGAPAGWAMRVDLGTDPLLGVMASPGSAGHPMAAGYDDGIAAWLAGEYRQVGVRWEGMRGGGDRHGVLKPATAPSDPGSG